MIQGGISPLAMKPKPYNKEKTMSNKIKISDVHVVEGNLYRAVGEDGELILYDCIVEAIVDGDIYHHKHVFRGLGESPDGFAYPVDAKSLAEKLVSRIIDAGMVIDLEHWVSAGNLSEREDPMDRLEREWSDNSDHFCDVDDGSICYENYNMGV